MHGIACALIRLHVCAGYLLVSRTLSELCNRIWEVSQRNIKTLLASGAACRAPLLSAAAPERLSSTCCGPNPCATSGRFRRNSSGWRHRHHGNRAPSALPSSRRLRAAQPTRSIRCRPPAPLPPCGRGQRAVAHRPPRRLRCCDSRLCGAAQRSSRTGRSRSFSKCWSSRRRQRNPL